MAIAANRDVVWGIQLLAFEAGGNRVKIAALIEPDDFARRGFAEVQARLRIVGHALRAVRILVRGFRSLIGIEPVNLAPFAIRDYEKAVTRPCQSARKSHTAGDTGDFNFIGYLHEKRQAKAPAPQGNRIGDHWGTIWRLLTTLFTPFTFLARLSALDFCFGS
jgi:hypothetical protein